MDITPDAAKFVIGRMTEQGREYLAHSPKRGLDACGTYGGAAKFLSEAGADAMRRRRHDAGAWRVWHFDDLHTADSGSEKPF
jgi:hypothetical protein